MGSSWAQCRGPGCETVKVPPPRKEPWTHSTAKGCSSYKCAYGQHSPHSHEHCMWCSCAGTRGGQAWLCRELSHAWNVHIKPQSAAARTSSSYCASEKPQDPDTHGKALSTDLGSPSPTCAKWRSKAEGRNPVFSITASPSATEPFKRRKFLTSQD